MKIGLATCRAYPNLTDDDRPILELLRQRGARGEPVAWDAPLDWSGFDAVVLRSVWDYHLRAEEFTRWLDALDAARVPLWNPSALVRWNMHKGYLQELAVRGLLVPETELVPRGDARALRDVLQARGWRDAIVKPAISASATDTWRTGDAPDDARYARMVAGSDVLVQEMVPEVSARGEWSLVFLGGAFSHAIIKRPRPGDFRVQVEHGGSALPARAPDSLVRDGEAIAAALPRPWLYTRVDGVATARGFMLMEIECIEPHLFLGLAAGAHERFVDALLRP